MKLFNTLCLIALLHGTLLTQTTWTYTGPDQGEWHNPDNWDIGTAPLVIGSGDFVNCPNGITVIVSMDIINEGQINVTGLHNTAYITNLGNISIQGFENHGSFENTGFATISTFNNHLGLVNGGQITIVQTGINSGFVDNANGTLTIEENWVTEAPFQNWGTIDIEGSLFNRSSITNFSLIINKGSMENGTGPIIGTLINNSTIEIFEGSTLENDNILVNNGTIENEGIIENNFGGQIENEGVIENNNGGQIENNSGGIIENNNGGQIENNSGGIIENNNGGQIENNSGGIIENNFILNNNSFITNTGTLKGAGQINQNGILNHNASASLQPGNSIGTLNITGDMDFGEATYEAELDGMNMTADLLDVTGDIDLTSSTLNVTWLDSPTTLGTYDIIEFSNRTGEFAQVNMPSIPGVSTIINYTPNTVQIEVTAVLPVELVSFSGKQLESDIHLDWTTSSEINNEGFYIERGTENGSWESVGFAVGQNNTSQDTRYNFMDTPDQAGDYLYRLRQIDYDGRESYSDVIAVKYVKDERFEGLSEIKRSGTARFYFETPTDQTIEFVLYDAGGRVIHQEKVSAQQLIDLSRLGTGMYFYSAQQGAEVLAGQVFLE